MVLWAILHELASEYGLTTKRIEVLTENDVTSIKVFAALLEEDFVTMSLSVAPDFLVGQPAETTQT